MTDEVNPLDRRCEQTKQFEAINGRLTHIETTMGDHTTKIAVLQHDMDRIDRTLISLDATARDTNASVGKLETQLGVSVAEIKGAISENRTRSGMVYVIACTLSGAVASAIASADYIKKLFRP